ncbi:MAG TPA: MFS transporter [Candidatus Dormibacteraeota bacterium]|nr:MFS transporter [Candidatus Dormibacteraeota bacterium]
MPRGYARYALAVMVGINFLNYLDRFVPAVTGPLIQQEFHLNDTQAGMLATSFLLVYAIGALPFGFWADRWVRKNIVAIGVTVWSVATVLTALSQSFLHLFIGRAVVGIGEASYYPAGTSLLSDYFPRDARPRALAIWNVGTALGIAVGFAGGGLVAAKFGWRAAFLMTAVPGLLFAILAYRLREPLRGAAETRGPRLEVVADATMSNFLGLLRNRTLMITIASQVPLYFVLGANANWLSFFLNRTFHLSIVQAGLVVGGVLVGGGLIGPLAGGWLATRWQPRSEGANLQVGMVGSLLGAVFVGICLVAPTLAIFIPALFLGVVCLYLYAGPYTAITQNVVVPSLRASAVTLSLLLSHLLGDAGAPTIVGFLSDHIGGLRPALLVTSIPLLLLSAGIASRGLRTIGPDTRSAEATWAEGPLEPVPVS